MKYESIANHLAATPLQPGKPTRKSIFPVCSAKWPLLLMLAMSATTIGLHAQSFSIDWFTIEGGGDTSSDGVYTISGIIGEPSEGVMSGGDFTLESGSWDLIAAPQAPRLLSISESPDGQFIIEWQVQSGRAYRLQFKESLLETNWTTLGEDHDAVGPALAIIVNSETTSHGFYRLLDVTTP